VVLPDRVGFRAEGLPELLPQREAVAQLLMEGDKEAVLLEVLEEE
jgi:hypothetical protein